MVWRDVVTARAELARVTRRYENVTETKRADGIVRHNCFISYHSADAPEVLDFVENFESVFIPRSVGLNDEDGPLIESDEADYIHDTIRDKYLRHSTVTIVMVGQCTWARRFVDNEVYSSLRSGKINRVNGLLAIELPSVAGSSRLPARVNDNYVKGGNSYAKYWSYPYNASTLQGWIQQAFDARSSKAHLIDNSRARRKRSSPCP